MDSQVAVKAVIKNPNGQFLIVRSSERWEGVGGRLEKGERLVDGLRREVREESGIIDLEVDRVIHVGEWFAGQGGELKHVVAIFFLCRTNGDSVSLGGEHLEHAWVTRKELNSYKTLEKEIKEAIILASPI